MTAILYQVLRIECALCILFGLWSHDWRTIFAGGFCLVVLPMLRHELVSERKEWK